MNDEEVGALAVRIALRFKGLTPLDLKLFLMDGVEGRFGEIKGSVDGALILQWILKGKKKLHDRIKHSNKEEDSKNAVPMPGYIKRSFQELVKKMNARNKSWIKPMPETKQYKSLEEYCEQNEVDQIEFFEKFEKMVDDAMEKMGPYFDDREALSLSIQSQMLLNINNGIKP